MEITELGRGVLLPESWHGQIAASLPNIDIGLPTVQKTARVEIVMDKKNPIYVQLSDGTRMFFTHEEFRRIPGGPMERGKKVLLTLLRRPDDVSETPSQIKSCVVLS